MVQFQEFNLYGVWERTKNNAQVKYSNIKNLRRLEEMLGRDGKYKNW